MDKIKLLKISVILLVLLNISVIVFMMFSNQSNKHHFDNNEAPHGMGRFRPEPREIIIEKLNFDNNQIEQYKKLINWHRNQISSLEDSIYMSKNELYMMLSKNEININKRDSLIKKLGEHQSEIEKVHFKHFQDIKSICRKSQLDDFNDLTMNLAQLFSHPKGPKH